MIGLRKVALLLVLSFLTVHSTEHHAHDANHRDSAGHADPLSAHDHYFHEYHHHHPVEQPNCGQVCPKSLPRFQQFEVGQVYTVDLDGQTLLNVKEGQTIGLKAKVDVHVLGPCEFSLSLRDSQVSGVPNPQELAQQLDSSPGLRFGAHDGKVLGVCPAPGEPIWTLNVKKAALSAMQLTTKDLAAINTVEEVDFSGHCTTTYRPLSDTSDTQNIIVEKSKNLNKCHLRRKNIAGFQSKSLGLLTEFVRENVPLLKSSQRCLQEIKGGHLYSVQCTEEQTLAMQAESLVISTLNLKFSGKAPKDAGAAGPVPASAQSLLMTRDDEWDKTATEADVRAILNGMCPQVNGDALSPEVTQSFHSLVRGLRTLPEEGTRALDAAVRGGQVCSSPKLRDLFLSASAFAASDPSIQTLIDAYNGKELTEEQIALALGLVALKTRPSDKTIDNMVGLIAKEKSERSLMLGASIMVRNYCKQNQNCQDSPPVQKTIRALIDKLQKTDCNLERITAIKALENIRAKTDDSVKAALLQWAEKPDADAGVRIAAIQGLKKLADDGVRQKLIDIFTKHSEPTEVRVVAYKTVVLSGASPAQLAAINSGADSQIKQYVQSHIRNLKKSSSPTRRALVPADAPEFGEPPALTVGVSRNIELAYKGATIESDFVFPKGSFVPSLYTFGLLFPVGGKDYQLAEVQIRQQGLSERFQKLLSKGIGGPEILSQLSEEMFELLKFARDPDHKHTLILQVSVRVAGSNVLFVDTFEDLHRVLHLIKDRLRELQGSGKIDLARGMAVLDQQAEVPQLLGFPMVVHLNETIVLAVKAEHSETDSGSVKTRTARAARSLQGELSAGLHLKVRNYRPGFEYSVKSEMHPTDDASSERIDNRILKLRINLPKERKSLYKVQQNVRLIDGNGVARESNEIADNGNDKKEWCRQLIGLNLCRSQSFVSGSPIPNVEWYVTKADAGVEALELVLERPPPSATRDLLVWSAKARGGEREYVAQIEVRNPKDGAKKASLKLVSPKRTITVDTTMTKSGDGNTSNIEFDLKLPQVIDLNTKYNYQVRGDEKQIDILSAYKLANSDKQETIKWNRKWSLSMKREKKTKIINVNYYGDFQSSQFPRLNSRVSYYTNLKPYQNSKSDFKVEWGPELKERVRVQHTSTMDIIELRPFQAVSENNFVVEATPLDVNYEVKLKTDISMLKSKPKHISLSVEGSDVAGRPNRAVRASLAYDRADAPLVQTINASVAFPGREMSYYSQTEQIKDWTFSGKTIISPKKGSTVNVDYKISSSKPTDNLYVVTESEVSFSDRPDKLKTKSSFGWASADLFEYKHTIDRDGQKFSDWNIKYDKKTNGVTGEMTGRDRAADFKVDNLVDPRSAQWAVKYGQKSYKMSAIRVPRDSLVLKLDSSENSRLKEFKAKVSRKEKTTLRLVYDVLEVNAFLDLISREKKAHLDFKCPKHNIEYQGDVVLNRVEKKLTWDSTAILNGKPFLTSEAVLTPSGRTFAILKKIKGDQVSKAEYFYEKGVYGAVIDTSQFSGLVEGEWKNGKNVGKVGFVDKVNNYEHKSHFNVSNGLITVKSLSDQDKESPTKLDAVIGLRVVSEVRLTTPKVDAHMKLDPLAEKKTLVVKWVSAKYEHDSNVEWLPLKYLSVKSVSQRKVEPVKRVSLDAYLTRSDDSKLHVTAPQLDIDIRRVVAPKPRFIFNTTINGNNEIEEFDSNPSLTPIQNLAIALKKYAESYLSPN